VVLEDGRSQVMRTGRGNTAPFSAA
jgi:hypothetical protein